VDKFAKKVASRIDTTNLKYAEAILGHDMNQKPKWRKGVRVVSFSVAAPKLPD